MFLGTNYGLTGIISRCRGQFVHIPPSDKRANPKKFHIPPPARLDTEEDNSSDESETDPENHSEYQDRASCCKMC